MPITCWVLLVSVLLGWHRERSERREDSPILWGVRGAPGRQNLPQASHLFLPPHSTSLGVLKRKLCRSSFFSWTDCMTLESREGQALTCGLSPEAWTWAELPHHRIQGRKSSWKLSHMVRAKLRVHNINEWQILTQNGKLSVPSSADFMCFPKSLWLYPCGNYLSSCY